MCVLVRLYRRGPKPSEARLGEGCSADRRISVLGRPVLPGLNGQPAPYKLEKVEERRRKASGLLQAGMSWAVKAPC